MGLYGGYEGIRKSDLGSKMRICTTCKTKKPFSEFPPDKRTKNGTQAKCRICINNWMKVRYRKNPAWGMWRRAKARSAKKGWYFSIKIEHLLPLPKICPVLGIRLRISKGPQDPQAYSLDRIDNKKEYVIGNVVVMSYKGNRLKNDDTAEEHEAIARWMRSTKNGDHNATA